MANTIYNEFLYELLTQSIDLANDTLMVALMANTYAPDKDDVYWADIVADEAAGTGYTTGGVEATTVALTKQDASDNVKISGDDVTFPAVSITARYAVMYKDTGDTATSPLVLCYDFGTDQTAVAGNFAVQWSANGIATLSQAV